MKDGKKLEIIKYNRSIQKKLKIYINDSEISCGRYKIEEDNGEIKEYDFDGDKLVFEGSYLNGKRGDKRKEKDGKEYNKYDELKFKGVYLNEIKNGKGKDFYNNNSKKFKDE